jgi:hypothetical protein
LIFDNRNARAALYGAFLRGRGRELFPLHYNYTSFKKIVKKSFVIPMGFLRIEKGNF